MRNLLLPVCLLLLPQLAACSRNDDRNATRHFLTEELTKCLDGTPAWFYHRAGDPRRFVLSFPGGGWCDSLANCEARTKTSLGSSAHAKPVLPMDWASFDDPQLNPLMHNWTFMHLAYCDGGISAGERRQSVRAPNGTMLHFHGRFILEAFLAEAHGYGLSAASDVVVTGGSAGALHILTHLDSMVPLINPTQRKSMRIVGFADSGFPLETTPFSLIFPFLISPSGHNGTALINPACRSSALPLARCLQPSASVHLLKSQVFIFNSRYDESDLINPAELTSCPQCGMAAPRPASCNPCITAFGSNLSQSIQRELFLRGSTSGSAAFIDSCSRHCGYQSGPLEIDGVSAYAAFAGWYRGGKRRLWVQNESYPCTTCCGGQGMNPAPEHRTGAIKTRRHAGWQALVGAWD